MQEKQFQPLVLSQKLFVTKAPITVNDEDFFLITWSLEATFVLCYVFIQLGKITDVKV